MTKKLLMIAVAAIVLLVAIIVFGRLLLPDDLLMLTKFDQNFSTGLSLVSITLEDIEKHNPPEQKNFDVLSYKLAVKLYPETKSFSSSAEIEITRRKLPGKFLPLNFSNELDVSELYLDGQRCEFIREGDLLDLSLPERQDTFSILIDYSGSPSKGLLFGETNNGYLIYSLNEPVFAPYWFPCIDSPSDKAQFEFEIENDSAYVSVANGKLVSKTVKSGRSVFHWQTNYPTATYLAAIYSGKYLEFDEKLAIGGSDTLSLKYYTLSRNLENAKEDFKVNSEAVSIYSKIFSLYPFIKEKYSVIEFLWNAGAIEHQTATGIGSNFISGKQFYTDILVHELAHSWWGNSVSINSWSDIWLTESFATYSEALYWEAKSGRKALRSTMNSIKGDFFDERLYSPNGFLFSRTIYNKGAWVLHMLRKRVGDDRFFELLSNYYESFKYKNASTDDFKQLAEEAAEQDLDKFFDQWVFNGTGIIRAEYSVETNSDGERFLTQIKIDQTQSGYKEYNFPVDARFIGMQDTVTLSGWVDADNSVLKFETKFKPQNIVLDPDFWLLADFQKIVQ